MPNDIEKRHEWLESASIQLMNLWLEMAEYIDEDAMADFLKVDVERYKKMLHGFKKYGPWQPDTCVRDMAPGDFSEELIDAANYATMQIVKVRRSCPDGGGGDVRNWSKPGIRAAPGFVPLRIVRGPKAIDVSPDHPKQFYVNDAGVDLVILDDITIYPFQTKDIAHDVSAIIPPGYWLEIRGCSSTAFKKRLQVYAGVLDNTFRGELKTAVHNPTLLPRKLRRGDRISQAVLHPLVPPEIHTTDDGGDTWHVSDRPHSERGDAGFGSTR